MAASPSRSLLRTGGIALLGVGVVAATVGLFTSVTGGNGVGSAVPSASSQAVAPTGATVAPAAPTAAPATAAPPTVVAAPPPPASAAPAPATQPAPQPQVAPPVVAAPAPAPRAPASDGGGTGGGAAVRAPLRVYNNSLIQGLAAKAKSDFEKRGWTVTDISGFPGSIPTSTAYYRPGTPEQAAAQELGREFGLQVEPRFSGLDAATNGVIVIVTKDYKPVDP